MENLQTSFKKSIWKVGGRLFKLGASPEADWKIIFVSTIVLIVSVVALSVFMFIKIDKGEIFVVQRLAGQGQEALNISILKETVSYYQKKAREFEKIKNEKVGAVDPSL